MVATAMAGDTDKNQLKLAAKTWWRWRQQFVNEDKDNDNDEDDKHDKHDDDDDKDNKHNDKDNDNNELILAAKTRWRWRQRWKQQLRAQQRLPQVRQQLPWALAQIFSFVNECHRGRRSSLILSWFLCSHE
jgi:hypothetical protein